MKSILELERTKILQPGFFQSGAAAVTLSGPITIGAVGHSCFQNDGKFGIFIVNGG